MEFFASRRYISVDKNETLEYELRYVFSRVEAWTKLDCQCEIFFFLSKALEKSYQSLPKYLIPLTYRISTFFIIHASGRKIGKNTMLDWQFYTSSIFKNSNSAAIWHYRLAITVWTTFVIYRFYDSRRRHICVDFTFISNKESWLRVKRCFLRSLFLISN